MGGGSTAVVGGKEAPDSLKATQHAVMIDLLSEGVIDGLADANYNPIRGGNPAAAVWFNQCPLANDANSSTNNFNGVSVSQVPGFGVQPLLPGFSSAEDTINVGVTLMDNVPYTFAIDDPATTRVSIGIRVPQLMLEDKKGNIKQYHTSFALWVWLNGQQLYWGNYIITGKCTSDYIREYIINLPNSATPDNDHWQIEVQRSMADDPDAKHFSTIILDYYTRQVNTLLYYPYCAVVGVQINAEQLSDIPTRGYRVKGMHVLVPTNYFPRTRRYTRDPYSGNDTGVQQPWNGTWYVDWSNNPAWCFFDMASNPRYGAGEFLGYNIDKWSLYQIACYCDQYVPDGFGGWEPRFTCNTYIQSQEQAWKVLTDLASVFRGMLYWGQGMIVPVADMPKPIMHSFTNANVVDGRFTYQDSELKNRNSDATVTYNDPQDFFASKTQATFDTDMRKRYGFRETKFTSFGCSSRGQAHRHGTYVLVTNRYETETVTFQTGFEAIYLRPGDVIGIVDNYRIGLRQGGRVKSQNGHWLTLDQAIAPFPDAQEISILYPQDVGQLGDYYPNSNAAANQRSSQMWVGYIYGMGGKASNVIYVQDVNGNVPPVPQGSVFVIGANWNTPLVVPQAEFRIISIAERAQNLLEITAVTYEKDKYNLIDFGIQFQPPLLTRIPPLTYVLPPNNVTAAIEVVDTNNVLTVNDIVVKWEQPPEANIRSYIVAVQPPNAGWVNLTETSSTSYRYTSVIPGLYHFRVSSVNTASIWSVPATTSITVPDLSLIHPSRISGLELQGQGCNFTFVSSQPVLSWRLNSPIKSFEPFDSEAPYGAGVGNYDPYFVHFQVTISDADTGKVGWTDHTTALQYTINFQTNVNAWGDGKARHHLTVELQVVDTYGSVGEAETITIDNPPPSPASNLTAIVAAGKAPVVVGLAWTSPQEVPATAAANVDVKQVNIYQGATSDFSKATRLAYHSADSDVWNSRPMASGTYWFFVTMVDTFGSESTPTGGIQVVVP